MLSKNLFGNLITTHTHKVFVGFQVLPKRCTKESLPVQKLTSQSFYELQTRIILAEVKLKLAQHRNKGFDVLICLQQIKLIKSNCTTDHQFMYIRWFWCWLRSYGTSTFIVSCKTYAFHSLKWLLPNFFNNKKKVLQEFTLEMKSVRSRSFTWKMKKKNLHKNWAKRFVWYLSWVNTIKVNPCIKYIEREKKECWSNDKSF